MRKSFKNEKKEWANDENKHRNRIRGRKRKETQIERGKWEVRRWGQLKEKTKKKESTMLT